MGGSRNRRDVRKWSKGWKMKPFNKYTERICTSPNSLRRNSCTSGLYRTVTLRTWSMSNLQLGKETDTRQTRNNSESSNRSMNLWSFANICIFMNLWQNIRHLVWSWYPSFFVCAKLQRHFRCKWLSAGLLPSAKLNSREERGQRKNLTRPECIEQTCEKTQNPSAFTLEPSGGQVLTFKANISKKVFKQPYVWFSVMKYVSQSSLQFCLHAQATGAWWHLWSFWSGIREEFHRRFYMKSFIRTPEIATEVMSMTYTVDTYIQDNQHWIPG